MTMASNVSFLQAELDQHNEIAVRSALGAVPSQRWLLTGDERDYNEWRELMSMLPRPKLEEVGAVHVELRPELEAQNEGHWVQLQPWIESQGYRLPSRYHPNWYPSWLRHPGGREGLSADAFWSLRFNIVDATRISDGARVILKICEEGRLSEVSIMAFFSSEPRRSDPKNHCYPLLDVLTPPLLCGRAHLIIVVPLLRSILCPPPDTVGELVKCFSDLAEGLEFMHANNVAHRDIAIDNVMMDSSNLVSEPWHPWRVWGALDYTVYTEDGQLPRHIMPRSRSKFPVKYYFTDFGSSSRFHPSSSSRLVVGIEAINRNIPELSETVPFDPFPADIRMFGDMVKEWKQRFRGLEFLDPLLTQMCHDDPAQRCSASEVVSSLDRIIKRTSRIALRAPLRLCRKEYHYYRDRLCALAGVVGDLAACILARLHR